MKKQDLLSLLNLLLVPCLLMLLGVILVANPDVASAMVAGTIGYILIAAAVIGGIAAMVSSQGKIGKALFSVALAMIGIWLVQNPLILAAWIGRVLGILIIINVLPDLVYAVKQKRSFLFHALAALAGGVLVMLPMTASRLVFTLCGIAVLVIGAVMFVDRIRGRRWLTAGEDPNIIDAL